jgi:sugar phosphate isomerase/epimerase
LNRRNFIVGTASIPVLASAQLPGADSRPGFHLGCVTYNLLKDADLETIIRLLETTGFEGVELRTGHKHGVEPSLGKEERARVRQLFSRSKVQLVSFGTTCEFHSPDPAERNRQVEIGKQFIQLARDTGAKGIKVRPNGLPGGVSTETTIQHIAGSLRELGDAGRSNGISVWMEVHGPKTSNPQIAAAIMRATNHPQVGLCWNSNPEDVIDGSVKKNFELLKPWVRHAHINELANDYPWRELFALMREAGYGGFTLAEVAESSDPERFLSWYKALWTELNRSCA